MKRTGSLRSMGIIGSVQNVNVKRNDMKYLMIVLMFVCGSCYGQKMDTVKAMILYCDTTETFGWDVVKWGYGYSVREKHNTGDGSIDPGMSPGMYFDYWQHIYYLDLRKNPLPNNIVVWQSKPLTP